MPPNNFKLQPMDVLVKITTGKRLSDRIERWGLGNPYTHVYSYLEKVNIIDATIPMLYESNGQGVVIGPIAKRYGESVIVRRLIPDLRWKIPDIITEAIKLANDPQAKYDYTCIKKFVIPRLILHKLHLPLAIKYHRDLWMICSEAEAEPFWRAGLSMILQPYALPPLPEDFLESPILETVWTGILSKELVA